MNPLWKHAAAVTLGLLACGTPLCAQSVRIIDGRPNNDRPIDFLLNGASLWTADAAGFSALAEPVGFEWTDGSKTRARAAGPGLQMFEGAVKAQEVILDFKDGKLSRATISVFNRGDVGDIPKQVFLDTIKTCQEKLGEKLSVPMAPYQQPGRTAVKIEGWIWKGKETSALLEASSQAPNSREFQGQFIRLRLAPTTAHKVGESGAPQIIAKSKLIENVKKEANGDVWIDNIPMVDQGQKGYCVVASCQRLMEFYGLQTDQHELAQLAETDDDRGTTAEGMMNALDRIERRMRLDVRDHMRWDYKDFIRVLDVYDRLARDKGAWRPEADPRDKDYIFFEMPIYAKADPDLMREAKASGGRFERFEKIVKENIDQGLPLLWTLMLGVYPEQGAEVQQSGGGHMRIISGYNPNGEIIFTDSWGAGHEKKRMKMKDAFAVTTGVYGMMPRR